jgi:hypothetical protein
MLGVFAQRVTGCGKWREHERDRVREWTGAGYARYGQGRAMDRAGLLESPVASLPKLQASDVSAPERTSGRQQVRQTNADVMELV